MNSVIPLVCAGILVGFTAAAVTHTSSTSVQAQAPQSGAPRIPPVANPPLYPAPPSQVVVVKKAQVQQMYAARVAASRSGSQDSGPRFPTVSMRTHGMNMFFRVKFDTPRPANRSGIVSLVDDADQHEGVTDFYVMTGGRGQMVTDGVIENRQYGHNPRGSAETGAKTTVVFPGEFNGQPIRDGVTHNVSEGDWLAIPPGVPHWPGFNPGDGLMYLGVKINIGQYGTNVMY